MTFVAHRNRHRGRAATHAVLIAALSMTLSLGASHGQGITDSTAARSLKGDLKSMTPAETIRFVEAFSTAWSTRSDADFAALWHPHGKLIYPFANRTIRGSELPLLNAITKKNAPELTWKLLDWAARGNVIVIEWESSNRYGERVVTWRGVDKLTLLDGKIIEEVVYSDTAPLQALRRGEAFQPLIMLPEPAP